MELSKLKHIQRYMTPFELDYRNFERLSQSQQLSNTFTPKIEEFFETLETEDLYMTSSHSIIEPISNQSFVNTFKDHNGPNQHQHTHKNTSQQHQYSNTSQQYQNRNTSQRYQPRYFQGPRTSSIPYLNNTALGVELTTKV